MSPIVDPARTRLAAAPSLGAAIPVELRLLMLPMEHEDGRQRMRWVAENGHPGHCSPDHRHSTPESALACFTNDKQEVGQ